MKFLDAVCALLGLRQYTTTTYDPQINGQTERFNRNLIQRLRYHVEKHQRDRDDNVQSLTSAYNTQVHRATEMVSFHLVLTCTRNGLVLPGAASKDKWCNREDPGTTVQYKRATLRKFLDAIDRARIKLNAVQKRHEDDFDKKVRLRKVIIAGTLSMSIKRRVPSPARSDVRTSAIRPMRDPLP